MSKFFPASMNKKILIAWVCFFLVSTCMYDFGECLRFLRRRHYDEWGALRRKDDARAVMNRQGALLSPLFAGPVLLATFLFALPLLPTLIMAPLAIAGIPPALNVITQFVSGTNGGAGPSPLSAFMAHFQDPLQTAASESPNNKPSTHPQIEILKNIAQLLRGAISKKHSPIRDLASSTSNVVHKDPIKPVFDDEFADMLTSFNSTNSTTDPMMEAASSLYPTSDESANSIEQTNSLDSTLNTLDRSLKTLQNIDTVVSSVRNIYSIIRNGLRRYEITDTNCQSRIVCEIHQKIVTHNKLLKTFSLSAIDLLSLEKQVDKWASLNDKSKQTIKFYIAAAKAGFADQDCGKVFDNCPTLQISSRALKNLFHYRKIFKRI